MWSTLVQIDWELIKVENTIFHQSRAKNFCVPGMILLIIELILDLVPINTSWKFGQVCLKNQVSIVLTRFKTATFNHSRAINFCVTMGILLIIKLIQDLVPINTSFKFGPDWLRNVVSITLPRKKLMDAWTNNHDISPSGLRPVELKFNV